MHELYIAECILNSARDALPNEVSPESVKQLQVQIGQLDAVVPANLIFLFDAIKVSHGMPQAELLIEQIGIWCRCCDCTNEFGIDIPLFICPLCGSGQVEVLRGRGITLRHITAEDSEGDNHGNTRHP